MKPLLLLLAIAAAGAYSYPSWHEQTATACQALDQRATLIANAESQGPMPFNLRPDTPDDSSGGVLAAAVGSVMPGATQSVGCAVDYWGLVLRSNIHGMLTSGG